MVLERSRGFSGFHRGPLLVCARATAPCTFEAVAREDAGELCTHRLAASTSFTWDSRMLLAMCVAAADLHKLVETRPPIGPNPELGSDPTQTV